MTNRNDGADKTLSAGVEYLRRFGAFDYEFYSEKFTVVKHVAVRIARKFSYIFTGCGVILVCEHRSFASNAIKKF